MRHLHFTQSLEPLNGGGLGSSTVALHRQFLARGLNSIVCATHGGTAQRLAARTFEFPRITPDAVYYSPALHRQAAALVRDSHVLHGHGFYVGTNFIFGGEARRQRKPLVYHVHGMFEPYILGRSRWKKRLVHWLFEDANFRNVRLWRALTVKEADQIRTCGLRAPIIIAPNGLDLNEYSEPGQPATSLPTPMVPVLKKNGPRLLFMARLHPKKGLDLLLRAWSKLGAVRKDWELIIAGPDEQGYLTRVQQLAGELALQDQITLTGAVTGATKKALLYSADLFILPSYSEGFPVSLLEAMACGIPVVATQACNFPEVAKAEAGWECDATVESIADALRAAVLSSQSERKQRGKNARSLVEKGYSWPRIVSTLLEACAVHC